MKLTYDFVYKALRLSQMFEDPRNINPNSKVNAIESIRKSAQMAGWPNQETLDEIDKEWDEWKDEIFKTHPWLQEK